MLKLNFMPINGVAPDQIRKTVANFIAANPKEWLVLTVDKKKEKRSLDQNAYYRGVVLPHVRKVRFDMGDPMGLNALHEDLLEQYAPRVEGKKLDGSTYTRPKRTREMTVKEMADFTTAIAATMAEFGEPVPEATHD